MFGHFIVDYVMAPQFCLGMMQNEIQCCVQNSTEEEMKVSKFPSVNTNLPDSWMVSLEPNAQSYNLDLNGN